LSDWLDVNLRGLQAAFRGFTKAAGSTLIERDGLIAAISKTVPERSFFNSVVYLDPDGLAGAYDDLAMAYAEAGCAWTVWVPERDSATARSLQGRGHTLDAQPRAMGIELGGIEEPDLSGLKWTPNGNPEQMSALNDAAYGYPAGTWIAGMGRPGPEMHIYVALHDGEPVATVSTRDSDGDASVWNVATAEAARGQGLSVALMRQALYEAQQRGCATSTLQATKLGAPIYRRCGYEDLGALGMWELRPPELATEASPQPAA
jgi:GNAT superfamily N-acetyltransferase